MRSTDSPDLSNPEPSDRLALADRLFLAALFAAQGLIWFLVGLSLGWLLWA